MFKTKLISSQSGQTENRSGDHVQTKNDQVSKAPRHVRTWPIYVVLTSAFVAVWGGWVGIGKMTGFGEIQLLPGIWDELKVNTAVTLPLGMEAYAGWALYIWTSNLSSKVRRFAGWSALAALVMGASGQVGYHVLEAAGYEKAPWQVTMGVSVLPVLVLGMASALLHMVTHDTPGSSDSDTAPVSIPGEAADRDLAPSSEVAPLAPPAEEAREVTVPETAETPRGTVTSIKQNDKVAELYRLVEAYPAMTAPELAAQTGLSERTVYRRLGSKRNTA